MKIDTKEPWILCGYETFSKEGQKGLKIEVIARQINKNTRRRSDCPCIVFNEQVLLQVRNSLLVLPGTADD